MKYNFDEIIDRTGGTSLKYDARKALFGTEDVIPMWVADMDFKTPACVFDAIRERTKHEVLGYFNHSDGFYSSIINWVQKRHGWKVEREWINFCPGVVPGLAAAVRAFTKEGEKVLIFPPIYPPFFQVIASQRRTIVESALEPVSGQFCFRFDDLEEKLKQGVKLVIFCNPQNPVGRSWSAEELRTAAELCLRYGVPAISDEIHSDLMMLGEKHVPMASISEQIAQNTITFMAPSKTFNLAGMASSEVIIPNKTLREQFCRVLNDEQHLQLGNTFGDVALEAAYTYGEEWLEELRAYLTDNVHYVQEFLAKELPQITFYKHEATYLLWLDCSGLGMEHQEMLLFFAQEAHVGVQDGKDFGKAYNCCVRMNVACPRSVLKTAMENISKAVANRNKK